MKQEPMVAVTANCNDGIFLGEFAALMALFLISTAALAAGQDPAAILEKIPETNVKRVILTAKAAERLGIETGKVGKRPIVLKQMVSGVIVPPVKEPPPAPLPSGGFGGFANMVTSKPAPVAVKAAAPTRSATPDETWLLVTLSPGEWDLLAKDKPARVLPLGTRDKLPGEVLAHPSGFPPLEDMKRSMLTLYYVVPGKDHGLTLHSRMRVELQLSGSDEKQKVVPYSAVYYDAQGIAWVYVNPKPLVYERRRVGVDRVVGDQAVLTEGPPVGTSVVTVGAALLYGVEIFGK